MKTPDREIVVLRNPAGVRLLKIQIGLVQQEAFAFLKASESMEEYDLPSRMRTACIELRNCLEEVEGGALK